MMCNSQGEKSPVRNKRWSKSHVMWLSLVLCLFGTVQAEGKKDKRAEVYSVVEATQQTQKVRGVITDKTGEPIIGVNIVLKSNKSIGTTTDMDGNYSIDVPSGAVLEFSYVGFKTKEEKVDSRGTINVVMEEDNQTLSEVVVVGYGTLQKKELTSAVTSVSSKDFIVGATNNAAQLIQGKVAGVSVSSTAPTDPNAGVSLQVRGASSIKSGNGPLIVIDGVPGGDLMNLSQADIESISILKDGSSAAIYGTRGANGVILVTTKKGARGEGVTTVDFDSYIATMAVAARPKLLSKKEFLSYGRDKDMGADTDWFDHLLRKSPFEQNYNLALSGSNKNSSFRAAVNYRTAEGLDISTDRKEYGYRFNFSHKALDGILEVFGNAAQRFADMNYTNYGAFNQAMQLNPTMPIMDPEQPTRYYLPLGYDTWNPVANLSLNKRGGERKYLTGDITFKVNILPNLSTQVLLAYQNNDRFDYYFEPSTSAESRDNGRKGFARRNYDLWQDRTLEWTANYYLTKDKHDMKVLAGYSYQDFTSSGFRAENANFSSDAFMYNKLSNGTWDKNTPGQMMDSWKGMNQLAALFARVNYSYDDTYLLSASVRYEGSSKFGKDNKWGAFPAASAGWRISNMSFMKDIRNIDDLKLRFGFGIAGRQDFDRYTSLATYSGAGQWLADGQWIQVFGPGNNPNPNLGWEKAINYNLGVDYSFFNGRLNGSVDFFLRQSRDMIYNYTAPVPPLISSEIWMNVGKTESKGVEMSINWDAIRGKEFNYSLNFIGSYTDSRVVSLSNEVFKRPFFNHYGLPSPGNPGDAFRTQEGKPIGSFYGYKYAGVTDDGKIMLWLRERDENGNIKRDDKGNLTEKRVAMVGSSKREEDKDFIGNGVPKVQLSLNNTFTYKGFDLSLFFRSYLGYDILNLKQMYYGLQAVPGVNLLTDAYGRNAHIKGEKEYCDYFLENGNFLKLDVVTLGYTFSGNNLPKFFKGLRLYASVKNALTITGYRGYDPSQVSITGLEPGIEGKDAYPTARTFTFGVKVNF